MSTNKKFLILAVVWILFVGMTAIPNTSVFTYSKRAADKFSLNTNTFPSSSDYHVGVISGTSPPSSGDWNISDTTIIENEKLIINGSIFVEAGGALVLKNSEIYLNSPGYQGLEIFVCSGGNLTIIDTKIASYSGFDFYMVADSDSLFYMSNATVTDVGAEQSLMAMGITVRADNATIINSIVYDAPFGIHVYDAKNVEIRNNTLNTSSDGITVEGSEKVTITNNTIQNKEFTGILVKSSSEIVIYKNTLRNCKSAGIEIDTSSHVTLYENELQKAAIIVTGSETEISTVEIAENNTVNGNMVKYYFNIENHVVKDNTFGELIFAYCKNITVKNVVVSTIELFNTTDVGISDSVIENSSGGVYVLNTEYLNMSNNTVQNNFNHNIAISNSSNIELTRNIIRNSYYGIIFGESGTGSNATGLGSNATLNATGSFIHAIRIDNNEIYNNTAGGIFGSMLTNLNITNNKIHKNNYINLAIDMSNNILLFNNTIENSDGAGMQMSEVYNVEIYENTIKFNGWAGIDLEHSDNTVVRGNLLEQNYYGIFLYECYNILVFLNNFSYNTHQAYDDNNNSFDNGTVGNYWSDYTGTDANGDGIGDTPYNISPNAKDNYPLVSPSFTPSEDTTPPIIVSVTRNVTNPTENDTVLIRANVTDNVLVSQVILSYRVIANGNGSWVNKTMVLNSASGLYEATIPPQPANTTVQYIISAKDSSGNWVDSSMYNYTVSTPAGGTSNRGLGNFPLDTTTTIIAGVAIGVVVVILFFMFKRKR